MAFSRLTQRLWTVLAACLTLVAAARADALAKSGSKVKTPLAVLYVAPDGNDDNFGTAEKPFRTLDRARQAVRKINTQMTGDIVVVLSGGTHPTQTLSFDAADSGTGDHNVIYRAASKQVPIISGGRQITGWQPEAGNRWKAKTDLENFRQLYVGGVRAVRARSGKLAGDTNAGRWEFWHNPSRGGRLNGA